MIDEQVDVLRGRFGSRETVERPAADGDVVTINLVASQDGEALPDATAEDLEYTVGSGQMLDGLDEAVTGLSAGESADLHAPPWSAVRSRTRRPTSRSPSPRSSSRSCPRPTTSFAQQASEFDTIGELRANIADAADRRWPASSRPARPATRCSRR